MQSSAFLNDKLRYRLGCFYDTLKVAANTATASLYTLFQAPISSSKGINETNMTDSGKLPIPVSMKIMALRVALVGMIVTDIERLYKNYCLRLKIGQKYFLEGPVNFFPGGGGVSGAVATTASATTIQSWSNGVPIRKPSTASGRNTRSTCPATSRSPSSCRAPASPPTPMAAAFTCRCSWTA